MADQIWISTARISHRHLGCNLLQLRCVYRTIKSRIFCEDTKDGVDEIGRQLTVDSRQSTVGSPRTFFWLIGAGFNQKSAIHMTQFGAA
jgi:hypothetical protein